MRKLPWSHSVASLCRAVLALAFGDDADIGDEDAECDTKNGELDRRCEPAALPPPLIPSSEDREASLTLSREKVLVPLWLLIPPPPVPPPPP
jgi:hypothetical protein